MHEVRFAEEGDRVHGAWAEIGWETDRGRPGHDDQRPHLRLECRLEGPVGHWTTADDGRQLVLAAPKTPSSAPGKQDEAGGGIHPCILPEFRVIPTKPLCFQGFPRSPNITI